MIGRYEKLAGYYFLKWGGVCVIRRGKTGYIIGDTLSSSSNLESNFLESDKMM